MAYTLKTTGLAADCICCVIVDDDNTSVEDLGANGRDGTDAMTYDAALPSPVSGTWKSETRYYWATRQDGFGYDGLLWSAGNRYNLEAGAGGSGYAIFLACEGDGDGNFDGSVGMLEGTTTAKLATLYRDGASDETSMHLLLSSEILSGSTSAWSTTAPFSAGWQHKRSGAADDAAIWYLLEASASTGVNFEASETPGADGQNDDLEGFGGYAGQGGTDLDIYCMAIFNRPLTITEWRDLHTDWFGELIEAPAGGGGEAASRIATYGMNTLNGGFRS